MRPARPQVSIAELPAIAEVVNGHTELVTYRGVRAVKLVPAPETAGKDEDMMALLDGPEFKDGTIEVDCRGRAAARYAARTRAGSSASAFAPGPTARGPRCSICGRPTGGRMISSGATMRCSTRPTRSTPGIVFGRRARGSYESYADMEAGAWTSMRIEVAGTTARLYVNGASQPCLIVNDLKHGDGPGRIALWAHVETDAYFGPVTVTAR